MTPLEKEIIPTLAYYAALGVFCLTPMELLRYRQDRNDSARHLSHLHALEALQGKGLVQSKNGYWALCTAPEHFYTARIRAQKEAQEKRRTFQGVCRFFPYIPFVRGVALIGSVARENASPQSDIDVCVVCAPGKLWTTRLLVTALTHLSGKRRHHNNIHNRICLNYYVSEDAHATACPDRPSRHIHAQSMPYWGTDPFGYGRNSARAFRPSAAGHALTLAGETLLRLAGYGWLERLSEGLQRAHIAESIARGKEGDMRITPHSLTFHLLRNTYVEKKYEEIMNFMKHVA